MHSILILSYDTNYQFILALEIKNKFQRQRLKVFRAESHLLLWACASLQVYVVN